MRIALSCGLIGLAAAPAPAQTSPVSFQLSNVTRAAPPNGRYQDPANNFEHGINKFTYDLLFSIDAADDWTAGGLVVLTGSGAKIYYNSGGDPNLPMAPGTSSPQKFSSFINNPRSQYADARFTTPTAIAGAYNPGSPTFVATETQLNVAWLELPPASTSLDTSAATVRFTIDTQGECFEGHRIYPSTVGPRRPGDLLLASVEFAVATQRNGSALSIARFSLFTAPCNQPDRDSPSGPGFDIEGTWMPASEVRDDPAFIDQINAFLKRNYWLR